MTVRIDVRLQVNAEEQIVTIEPNWTLLKVVRETLGLTGSKEGCATGACGACTMLVDGEPVYSCLSLAATMEGRAIQTIEGLLQNGEPHPIQLAFVEQGGIQCGFCTPGMIMASKALLERTPNPTEEEIREGLSGNFCRCTGYTKIFKSVEAAAAKMGQAG
jgi:carbon-monoxide dehydrogenase small subunit